MAQIVFFVCVGVTLNRGIHIESNLKYTVSVILSQEMYNRITCWSYLEMSGGEGMSPQTNTESPGEILIFIHMYTDTHPSLGVYILFRSPHTTTSDNLEHVNI